MNLIRHQDGKTQYWCETTHQYYEPLQIKRTDGILWCLCPLCDSHRRTGADYNGNEPQWHGYLPEPEPTDEVQHITALVTALEWTPHGQ